MWPGLGDNRKVKGYSRELKGGRESKGRDSVKEDAENRGCNFFFPFSGRC